MLAQCASHRKQSSARLCCLRRQSAPCALLLTVARDNPTTANTFLTAEYNIRDIQKETHLKVGQDHFSIHVAIAAFGGHGNDWLKAILLPLALVAFSPHRATLGVNKILCLDVATSERLAKWKCSTLSGLSSFRETKFCEVTLQCSVISYHYCHLVHCFTAAVKWPQRL